jgi:ribosomal protein S13
VGFARANYVLSRLGFRYPYWAANLNYSLFNEIAFILNRLLISKVKAQRTINLVIKELMELQTLRGKRHSLHLPTRGQRTRTNGRTVKRLFRVNFAINKKYGKNH